MERVQEMSLVRQTTWSVHKETDLIDRIRKETNRFLVESGVEPLVGSGEYGRKGFETSVCWYVTSLVLSPRLPGDT